MISHENLLGLPHYDVIGLQNAGGEQTIEARYTGPSSCPHCQSTALRNKGNLRRKVRHVSWSSQHVQLIVHGHIWLCRSCGRKFREQFPGLLKNQRATEAFQHKVFQDHWDGINRARVAARERIGSATVERYCLHFLRRLNAERSAATCPRVLGMDEHFFTRRKGYATTFCDLRNHSVFDVVLGRSEAALESYLSHLEGKQRVRIVCMDLSSTYRALVRKHFPKARIVADRFHVIRLINHHFLACWRDLDAASSRNRGLLSLMRRHRHNLKPEQKIRLHEYLARHPALQQIYFFKQKLCYLLLQRTCNRKKCNRLAPRLVRAIDHLRHVGLPTLVTLGESLHSWITEIASMWRFSRSNGITEGFHTKMEMLQRQAFGFRNFNNYRLRVRVLCSSAA